MYTGNIGNTSMVEALKAKNLYASSGQLGSAQLVVRQPSGKERQYTMEQMDYNDIKIFADEFDVELEQQNPYYSAIFAKNAEGIVNLIRAVNYYSTSGFKGNTGAGRQLDAVLMRAEQTQDPDQGGIAARTSWIRTIGAAGTLQYLCQPDALGANIHAALAIQSAIHPEGIFIGGFSNGGASPCIDAIQMVYLADTYNIQNLDFDYVNPEVGDSFVELKQPLFLFPNETILISMRYYKPGIDETRTIGCWIKMASDLRALATS